MFNNLRQLMFLSILLNYSFNLFASEYVPDVYEDDYIIVRSGIVEAGKKPVNLGDRISLIIEAEFPADEVIVENLDEQLFERSWGSEKGISLIGPPVLTRVEFTDGTTVIRSTFNFQVLDCPGELTSCRGNKIYELPVFTLGYQIIDGSGNVLNNKSVRFNPVPSYIVVMQALDIRGEGGLDDLSAYLGNNGYPGSMEVPADETARLWPIMTGGLIFLASFFPLLLTGQAPKRAESKHGISSRWESVLAHIKNNNDDLSDDEWSDKLRRCVTWYSLDELGENPYEWVGNHASNSHNQEFRDYFIDVLNQEGISRDKRDDFISRFSAVISTSGSKRR